VLVAHERVALDPAVRLSSNRAFGFSLSVLFALAALAQFLTSKTVRWPALIAAGCMAIVALLCPGLLGPLHQVWFRAALVLHRVMGPLLLSVLFFGMLTPLAALMRLFGRRLPEFQTARSASYWHPRDITGVSGSMGQTF
jgi:cytochrome c oxidase subunit IV